MDKQKLKEGSESFLRGGFCMLWIFAIPMSIMNFMNAMMVEDGSAEQNNFLLRTFACIGVLIVAAMCHAHLMRKACPEK
jgi:hypothetical protein